MARTNVPVLEGVMNAGTAATLTGLDPTNGHNIAASGKMRKMLLFINNTGTTLHTYTVKAGDNPPANRAGQGDLVVGMNGTTYSLVQLESARFMQDDGSINIDISAGFTGAMGAFRIGKGNA
jgi:hypothetical protein